MSVEFDGPVVTEDLQVALTIGTETRYPVMFSRAIGRHFYYFEYTVQEVDRDEDGNSIPANALILNGGTIALAADGTIDADLTHAAANPDPTRKVSGSTDSPGTP